MSNIINTNNNAYTYEPSTIANNTSKEITAYLFKNVDLRDHYDLRAYFISIGRNKGYDDTSILFNLDPLERRTGKQTINFGTDETWYGYSLRSGNTVLFSQKKCLLNNTGNNYSFTVQQITNEKTDKVYDGEKYTTLPQTLYKRKTEIILKANDGYKFKEPPKYTETFTPEELSHLVGKDVSQNFTFTLSDDSKTAILHIFMLGEKNTISAEPIIDESVEHTYLKVTSNTTNCTVVSDVSKIVLGSNVTINLKANDGYGFKVAPTITEGTNTHNFNVSEDKSTANITFTANSDFTITAGAVKFVKWTNNAKNCTVDGINNVLVGDKVNITITPNNGYEIVGTPDINAYGTLSKFTVGDDGIARLTKKLRSDDDEITITAKTQIKPNYLNVTSNVTNCTVVSDVTKILAGTEVTINLNAADGYGFKVAPKITEGSTEINFITSENKLTASVTFTPNSDFTITANGTKFVVWDISAVKNSTIEGIANVFVGDTINLTITPNSGYVFDGNPYINRYGTLKKFTVGTDGIARLENLKLSYDDENVIVYAKTKENVPKPTTNAGFLRIFTPTENELDLLSQYGFINPTTMDTVDLTKYIYGLYRVFIPVSSDGKSDIFLSRNDTKIESNYTDNAMVKIDGDEIELTKKYNNVFDFSPYTKTMIYVPFIGNVNVDTDILYSGKIKLSYIANLLTMDIMSIISIDGKEFYRNMGKCGYNIPFNLARYSYNANNLATNNYLYDLKPKIIFTHSVPYDNGNDILGRDINKYLENAKTLTGLNSCKIVRWYENENMTETEKQEIESLLADGVYF